MRRKVKLPVVSEVASAFPRTVRQTLRVNLYEIVSRAVEEGAFHGLRRTWKHRSDEPSEEVLADAQEYVRDEVMAALCEVVEFGDPEAA